MMPIECRGLLFDLDGVLVDSTPAVARVWAVWARKHGFQPDEVVKKAHGRPSLSTIRELLPDADHGAEDREVERCEIADLEGVIPLPGAMALLQALPMERWAIVTSCTHQLAGVRIGAAGLPRPRHLVTATDVMCGKPHPEPYLKGAQVLGVATGECIVIEDAPAGICAGRAAGARVIALRTTAEDRELVKAGAHWIVDDCRSISVEVTPDRGSLVLLLQQK
jgi:sugar-phosphatase